MILQSFAAHVSTAMQVVDNKMENPRARLTQYRQALEAEHVEANAALIAEIDQTLATAQQSRDTVAALETQIATLQGQAVQLQAQNTALETQASNILTMAETRAAEILQAAGVRSGEIVDAANTEAASIQREATTAAARSQAQGLALLTRTRGIIQQILELQLPSFQVGDVQPAPDDRDAADGLATLKSWASSPTAAIKELVQLGAEELVAYGTRELGANPASNSAPKIKVNITVLSAKIRKGWRGKQTMRLKFRLEAAVNSPFQVPMTVAQSFEWQIVRDRDAAVMFAHEPLRSQISNFFASAAARHALYQSVKKAQETQDSPFFTDLRRCLSLLTEAQN